MKCRTENCGQPAVSLGWCRDCLRIHGPGGSKYYAKRNGEREFYLEKFALQTQWQVAKALGISPAMVWQIERDVLRKIRGSSPTSDLSLTSVPGPMARYRAFVCNLRQAVALLGGDDETKAEAEELWRELEAFERVMEGK